MAKKVITFIVFLIILVFISFFFIFKPVNIAGPAMAPNYKNGERYLTNKLAYVISKPKRGDVVVYWYPQSQNYLFIGRIIGLPGESFKIQGGKTSINNKPLIEEYLAPGTTTEAMKRREFKEVGEFQGKLEEVEGLKVIEEGQEIILPEESYFIMGDNRDEGIDSRSLGFVKLEGIIGKLSLKY